MITLILLCVYISVVVSDIPFWSSGHNDDDVTRYFKVSHIMIVHMLNLSLPINDIC